MSDYKGAYQSKKIDESMRDKDGQRRKLQGPWHEQGAQHRVNCVARLTTLQRLA